MGIGFQRMAGVDAQGTRGSFAGVNATLRGRLDAVEGDLQRRFDALAAPDRVRPEGGAASTVAQWVGVRGPHIGWRPDTSGHHRSGSAIDIDAARNPYIAIRQTSTNQDGEETATYGGEEATRINQQARPRNDNVPQRTRAEDINTQRAEAVAVYDRARRFAGAQAPAEVGPRRGRESNGAQHDRMQASSDALSTYLGMVFSTAPGMVQRRPVTDPQNAEPSVLTAAVTEAAPAAAAVARIQAHLTAHPQLGWGMSADQTYIQILRDYESVRIPMQRGAVTTTPRNGTRNPAAGFLHFTRAFTEAMTGAGGLRWGGTQMGMESGDMMHFDLGSAATAVLPPAEGGVCQPSSPTPTPTPTSG